MKKAKKYKPRYHLQEKGVVPVRNGIKILGLWNKIKKEKEKPKQLKFEL